MKKLVAILVAVFFSLPLGFVLFEQRISPLGIFSLFILTLIWINVFYYCKGRTYKFGILLTALLYIGFSFFVDYEDEKKRKAFTKQALLKQREAVNSSHIKKEQEFLANRSAFVDRYRKLLKQKKYKDVYEETKKLRMLKDSDLYEIITEAQNNYTPVKEHTAPL